MTQEEAHRLWRYDQGRLYWRVVANRRLKIGDEAGCVHGNGYREVSIRGKTYGTHRVVFLMFHGYLPEQVDHIDGNPLNNSVGNLRAATHILNGHNRKINVNNSSGVKNVSFCRADNKWKVTVMRGRKPHFFGGFDSLADAAAMAAQARRQLHGDFARDR